MKSTAYALNDALRPVWKMQQVRGGHDVPAQHEIDWAEKSAGVRYLLLRYCPMSQVMPGDTMP
ncbi:MAG TPA: hypothetical protein PKM88_01020 [bacterium]|nr:hypothetical protein [bacterium]